MSIKNSDNCCQSLHTVGVLKDQRGGQIQFYLSELPGTEPGASHTEACRRYRSRWRARHKAALRRALDRLRVSPERTCVCVGVGVWEHERPPSLCLSLLSSPPFYQIVHYLLWGQSSGSIQVAPFLLHRLRGSAFHHSDFFKGKVGYLAKGESNPCWNYYIYVSQDWFLQQELVNLINLLQDLEDFLLFTLRWHK